MAWDDITAGDFGWDARLLVRQDGVALDISSYTTRQYLLRDPSGNEATVTAAFATDGTDGLLSYTVADGDIDEPGRWTVRARISKSGALLTSGEHVFWVGAE